MSALFSRYELLEFWIFFLSGGLFSLSPLYIQFYFDLMSLQFEDEKFLKRQDIQG